MRQGLPHLQCLERMSLWGLLGHGLMRLVTGRANIARLAHRRTYGGSPHVTRHQ
jgi:hypothetical protein